MTSPLIFTDDELCRFFDQYNEVCYDVEPEWRWQGYFLVSVLITFGLRMNEARLLKVEDCHEYPYCIMHVANGKGSRYHKGEPKPRDVDCLPQFEEHYKRHIQIQRDRHREYVFRNTRASYEKPFAYDYVHEIWERILAECGLPPRGTHAGRRSYASYVHRIPFPGIDGKPTYMSPIALCEQLGHSDGKLLMSCYNKPMPGHRFPNGAALKWPDRVAPKKQPD